ncbi:MAG: bifunctional adenosylcobinamide kinase/adenosylcobinamide-phosphate guanylyltransferase [Nocardioides sp.]
MRTLVTGGVRCGKSRHAEALLAAAAGDGPAVYVAAGPVPTTDDDPDWVARVAAHRDRRPAGWSTHESGDLVAAIALGRPVLVDCLGTWLTGVLDTAEAWEWPVERLESLVAAELDRLLPALASATADVVLVTNEVGWGVVPSHRSGRVFRDLLGTVNQRVATACDEVHLVVAGRVLVL